MSSVAKELFTRRFWMDVEERAFYSDDWIREVGIMGVTSTEEAEAVLSRYRRVKVTIPMVSDYLSSDFKLQFVDKSDAPIMFNIINTHLSNWVNITNTLGHVSTIPPIEDFEALDALAEKLYAFRTLDPSLTSIFSLFKGPISKSTLVKMQDGI